MTAAASLTVAYRDLFKTGSRPYLYLWVTGVNGRSGAIPGLVDSGADQVSLPDGFAPLMGYADGDLDEIDGTGADGSATWRRARQASSAYVPEMPAHVFSFVPIFTPGDTALWGRQDFFATFAVSFDEPAQRFDLTAWA